MPQSSARTGTGTQNVDPRPSNILIGTGPKEFCRRCGSL